MVRASTIAWYIDQTFGYIGLIISILLFATIAKKIGCTKQINGKPFRCGLRFYIYFVFTSCIFFVVSCIMTAGGLGIIGAISPGANQYTICNVIYTFGIPSLGILQTAIINLFIERLYISFGTTGIALSKCSYYSFKIIYSFIWLILSILFIITVDSSPYNIYSGKEDSTGNGMTCSSAEKGVSPIQGITLFCGILSIFISNIIIWLLFMNKLSNLIKTTVLSDRDYGVTLHTDNELILLMKEQTFIVCIAVFSTIILWLLLSTSLFGQYLILIDGVFTSIVIFMSFKFNRFWFELFKCHTASNKCCKPFEKWIIRGITLDEIQLSKEMQPDRTSHDQTQEI